MANKKMQTVTPLQDAQSQRQGSLKILPVMESTARLLVLKLQ